MDKMNRRGFLKSLGVAGAGTIAAATLDSKIAEAVKEKPFELAHFEDAHLRRDFFGDWQLSFSSPDEFDPLGYNSLIIEIGSLKFQLHELKGSTISRFGDKYRYVLSGSQWERIYSQRPTA